ncbi:MAG: NADH-quinone oxidoreductase subunit N [Bacteroidota bacterium]
MVIQDLANTAALLSLTVVSLVLLVIESARVTRADLAYYLSLVGIAVSAGFAMSEMSLDGTAYSDMIRVGGYSSYFTLLFLAAAFLTILFSRDYLKKLQYHRGEYYILVVLATIGMTLMASALDLIVIFLGIELMSVCLYVLAGFFRAKEKSNEASVKYFLLGAFATGFLLYGIALIYGATGTTNILTLREHFALYSDNGIFLIGAGMLIVSFGFKVAAVPFHMWAPDVYEGAPTMVTGFMSTGAKAAAFSAFAAVFIGSFEYRGSTVNEAIALLAAASMIIGNITAVVQSNLKRMLAYSSIAHAGYMLSGIAAGNPEGQAGILFYLVAYTFMNLGAFGIVSMMEKEEDKGLTFADYAGLSSKSPFMAALMSLFMFSLAGIPPFAGFFGKYYVFLSAVKADMAWLAIVGVLTSVVSAYYYLRLVVLMYFRDGEADFPAKPSVPALVAVSLAALLVIQLGIYPSLIVDIAQRFH